MPQLELFLRDPQLLLAFANGASVTQAALRAGVSRATAYRRLKDPTFADQLHGVQREMLGRAVNFLTKKAARSARTLDRLQDPANPPAIQLGAARAALQCGERLRREFYDKMIEPEFEKRARMGQRTYGTYPEAATPFAPDDEKDPREPPILRAELLLNASREMGAARLREDDRYREIVKRTIALIEKEEKAAELERRRQAWPPEWGPFDEPTSTGLPPTPPGAEVQVPPEAKAAATSDGPRAEPTTSDEMGAPTEFTASESARTEPTPRDAARTESPASGGARTEPAAPASSTSLPGAASVVLACLLSALLGAALRGGNAQEVSAIAIAQAPLARSGEPSRTWARDREVQAWPRAARLAAPMESGRPGAPSRTWARDRREVQAWPSAVRRAAPTESESPRRNSLETASRRLKVCQTSHDVRTAQLLDA